MQEHRNIEGSVVQQVEMLLRSSCAKSQICSLKCLAKCGTWHVDRLSDKQWQLYAVLTMEQQVACASSMRRGPSAG